MKVSVPSYRNNSYFGIGMLTVLSLFLSKQLGCICSMRDGALYNEPEYTVEES